MKTIPCTRLHMGNYLFHYMYSGESSVTRIDIVIVCVYHVFVANHLTGVQMGNFIGEND